MYFFYNIDKKYLHSTSDENTPYFYINSDNVLNNTAI